MYLVLSLILILFCSPVQANLKDGLVGWWALEEGTGTAAKDNSYHGNSGTLQNGPVWKANCARGTCVGFDGSNDRLDITNNVLTLDPTIPVSISAWQFFPALPGAGAEAFGNIVATGNFEIFVGIDSTNHLNCSMAKAVSTAQVVADSATATARTWNLVSLTYDGSTMTCYVNGTSIGTAVANATTLSATSVTAGYNFGCRRINGSGANFFPGSIDDGRVYNRVLTAQEELDLYNSGVLIKGTGTQFNY